MRERDPISLVDDKHLITSVTELGELHVPL